MLVAPLIPGMQEAWNHPQFFDYVDGWMLSPDDPRNLETIQRATGMTIDADSRQGQSWKILSGGSYYERHRPFVDEMWAAYWNTASPPAPPPNAQSIPVILLLLLTQ